MQKLWKKEKTQSVVQFVDLFAELNKYNVPIGKSHCESTIFFKNNQLSINLRNLGNEEFSRGEWNNAMNYYNKSLCFAEIGSENVALAYVYRSMCFFHMKKYRETLVDIAHAKNALVSEQQLPDLDKCRRECENLIIASEKTVENFPKLSYDEHEQFRGLANVLDMKISEQFGRHFIAKCDIPVGKIILEEDGLIGVRKDNETMCCSNCLQVHASFIACQYCSSTLYCGMKCEKLNTSHKFVCGTRFNLLHHEIRFHMQAIFRALEAFHDVERLMPFVEQSLIDRENLTMPLNDAKSKYSFFFQLSKSQPAADDIFLVNTIYMNLMEIPRIIELFDSVVKRRFLMHLVAHHFLVILNNTHGGRTYQSLGNIFSMFNHSCAPNLLQYFDKKQHLVTIRPVKKGHQLFICYLGKGNQSLDERRKTLKSNWNFVCTCERCNPSDEAFDRNLIVSDPHFEFVLSGYLEEKSTEVLRKCSEILNKYGHSPWSEEIQFVINIYCAHLVKNNLIDTI